MGCLFTAQLKNRGKAFVGIKVIRVHRTDNLSTFLPPGILITGLVFYWVTWDMSLDLNWDGTNKD